MFCGTAQLPAESFAKNARLLSRSLTGIKDFCGLANNLHILHKHERLRDGSLRKPEINPRAATLFALKADNSKTGHLLSTLILLLPLHSLQ